MHHLNRHTFTLVTMLVAAVALILRVVSATLVPIIEDEAYYAQWSHSLDFGYFDHPPMIAWIGVTTLFAESSALAARLGCILVSALFVPFAASLLKRAGVHERKSLLTALVLMCFGLYAIVGGMLLTPDALLIVAWCAALSESAAALDGRRERWLTAGVAVGFGLLCKYIMVLIGPVLLIALLASDRGSLRTRWPWLGALVAMILISPHLLWNAQHEWVSFRLQLLRGFAETHEVDVTYASPLPRAQAPVKGSFEWAVGAYFSGMDTERIHRQMSRIDERIERSEERQTVEAEPSLKKSSPRSPSLPFMTTAVHALARTAEYVAGLGVLWGFLIIPVAHSLLLRAVRRTPCVPPNLNRPVRHLLIAATLVPMVFFGAVSLIARVEGNWAGIYFIGLGVLLAGYAATHSRLVIVSASMNALLVIVVSIYAANPPARGGANRLLEETSGWRELANYLASLDAPVLADAHQTIAQIQFHAPSVMIAQWPGITRPSEYVRRSAWNQLDQTALQQAGGFYLLISSPRPPLLPGFVASYGEAIICCVGQPLERIKALDATQFLHPCPNQNIHTWYLLKYEPKSRQRIDEPG